MSDLTQDQKRDLALTALTNCIRDFFYYNREDDEELSKEDLQELIKDEDLTKDTLVAHFEELLDEYIP